MRRNYNQSFPSLPSTSSSSSSSSSRPGTSCSSMRKRITNFQSDSTEVQVIAILWLARIEMEEKLNKSRNSSVGVGSPYLQFQLHPSSRGPSLKKSLQKFLQKRKDRYQATMPYSH